MFTAVFLVSLLATFHVATSKELSLGITTDDNTVVHFLVTENRTWASLPENGFLLKGIRFRGGVYDKLETTKLLSILNILTNSEDTTVMKVCKEMHQTLHDARVLHGVPGIYLPKGPSPIVEYTIPANDHKPYTVSVYTDNSGGFLNKKKELEIGFTSFRKGAYTSNEMMVLLKVLTVQFN